MSIINDLSFRKQFPKEKKITAQEFFAYTENRPESERYELINGRVYMMAAPNINHQRIIGEIYRKLGNYLDGKPCEPFISPLDVVLFEKDKTTYDDNKNEKSQNVFQPDVLVVCDPDKIGEKRINGAPDLVIEVVSPSSETHDYLRKQKVYMTHGVKEYWIVDPQTKEIIVYINTEDEEDYKRYTFGDKIKAGIFPDFEVDFKELQI
jgi:Uma2 family endonuclease